jgi:hypothetical protein
MVRSNPDLHSLVYGTPWIDPRTLLAAIDGELRAPAPDFRTRLLLRDSMNALERRWGGGTLLTALSPDVRGAASRILTEDLGEPGFTTLDRRMADATSPEAIADFLRTLGEKIHTPARLAIGGSASLILWGMLQRPTDNVDAVSEVPAPIRVECDLLGRLTARFGLRLAHFQSCYLPTGWERRLQPFLRFGSVDVRLVEPFDTFAGKLFSEREKDRDDLRMLKRAVNREAIEERLKSSCAGLLGDPARRAMAERNWYILFGEPLPA